MSYLLFSLGIVIDAGRSEYNVMFFPFLVSTLPDGENTLHLWDLCVFNGEEFLKISKINKSNCKKKEILSLQKLHFQVKMRSKTFRDFQSNCIFGLSLGFIITNILLLFILLIKVFFTFLSQEKPNIIRGITRTNRGFKYKKMKIKNMVEEKFRTNFNILIYKIKTNILVIKRGLLNPNVNELSSI